MLVEAENTKAFDNLFNESGVEQEDLTNASAKFDLSDS